MGFISVGHQCQSIEPDRNLFFQGQALAENASLQSLDLSWNSISGKGAIALIKGIQV